MRDNRVLIDGQPLPLKAHRWTDFPGTAVTSDKKHRGQRNGHWPAFIRGAGQPRNLHAVRLKRDEFFLVGDNRYISLDWHV